MSGVMATRLSPTLIKDGVVEASGEGYSVRYQIDLYADRSLATLTDIATPTMPPGDTFRGTRGPT